MALTKVINNALGFPLALSGNRTYIATNTFMGKSAGNNTDTAPDGGTWDTVYTTHTLNGSTKYCIIQLFGGGGQGARTHNPHFGGAGGGSGAYVKFLLDVTDSNLYINNCFNVAFKLLNDLQECSAKGTLFRSFKFLFSCFLQLHPFFLRSRICRCER